MPGATIDVEVVYALPERQELVTVTLPAGAAISDAIAASGLAERVQGVELGRQPVGIWGRRVTANHRLADGDRVEIYRPLRMDPREARRTLAAHGKAMGQHDNGDK